VEQYREVIIMDKWLNEWFDVQSKKLDEAEKKEKKDLITGEKND
jgi:hypothetical protein